MNTQINKFTFSIIIKIKTVNGLLKKCFHAQRRVERPKHILHKKVVYATKQALR